jgi:hypothetical protein
MKEVEGSRPIMTEANTWSDLSTSKKVGLYILGFFIGIAIGAVVVFNILFLSKVIPHGGIL